MNSPLGKYSQAVAAVVAVSIISAYLLAVLLGELLSLPPASIDRLQVLALIAVGAVFGSAATINGVKAPLDAAHNRIDRLEAATKIPTHGVYPIEPEPPPNGSAGSH
jgi:hypothetical protein